MSNVNNGLVVFTGNGEVSKVTTNKAGITTMRFIPKKEYGEQHGIKGAALGRAHTQYRIDRAVQGGNTNVAAMIARGEILIETYKLNKAQDGGSLGFTLSSKLGAAPQRKPEEVAADLSIEALQAILAGKQAAAAPAKV